jgi:hypothetical protein
MNNVELLLFQNRRANRRLAQVEVAFSSTTKSTSLVIRGSPYAMEATDPTIA